MNRHTSRVPRARAASGAVLVILLPTWAGCSHAVGPIFPTPDPAIVWPNPPDAPRVRFVGQLQSSDDLGQAKRFIDAWNELLYGPVEPARLITPYAVAVDAGGHRVAVADTNGACVHVFDLGRREYERIEDYGRKSPDGQNTGGSPVPHEGRVPVGVAWANDVLCVADSKLGCVALVEPDGSSRLIGTDILQRPAGVAFDPTSEQIFVCDTGMHCVFVFDLAGRLIRRFGQRGSGPGEFNFPTHLACGPQGVVVVADTLNFRIQRFAGDGTPRGMFGSKGDATGDFALPKGVAIAADGTLWVVDAQFENVQAFTSEGDLLLAFGGEGHGPGEFWLPAGICIDRQQRMWIADSYNRRVQVFELLEVHRQPPGVTLLQ